MNRPFHWLYLFKLYFALLPVWLEPRYFQPCFQRQRRATLLRRRPSPCRATTRRSPPESGATRRTGGGSGGPRSAPSSHLGRTSRPSNPSARVGIGFQILKKIKNDNLNEQLKKLISRLFCNDNDKHRTSIYINLISTD